MLRPFNGKHPRVGKNCFIAENAVLIGDVTLGDNCSIWYGAVLRADMAPIILGDNCNIQDNCVVHVNSGLPAVLGDRVSVGHGAIVHGAKVEENSLIGMGAILLDGAHIGRGCIVGAGALVAERKEMPDHTLCVGVPARVARELDPATEEDRVKHAEYYKELAAQYLLDEQGE